MNVQACSLPTRQYQLLKWYKHIYTPRTACASTGWWTLTPSRWRYWRSEKRVTRLSVFMAQTRS